MSQPDEKELGEEMKPDPIEDGVATKQTELRKILFKHLVEPTLALRMTHPDYNLTKEGYDILIENTIEDITAYIRSCLPEDWTSMECIEYDARCEGANDMKAEILKNLEAK